MDIVLLDLQDNRLVELPGDFLSQMVSLRKLSLNKNRYRRYEACRGGVCVCVEHNAVRPSRTRVRSISDWMDRGMVPRGTLGLLCHRGMGTSRPLRARVRGASRSS